MIYTLKKFRRISELIKHLANDQRFMSCNQNYFATRKLSKSATLWWIRIIESTKTWASMMLYVPLFKQEWLIIYLNIRIVLFHEAIILLSLDIEQ